MHLPKILRNYNIRQSFTRSVIVCVLCSILFICFSFFWKESPIIPECEYIFIDGGSHGGDNLEAFASWESATQDKGTQNGKSWIS
eukprot:UN26688